MNATATTQASLRHALAGAKPSRSTADLLQMLVRKGLDQLPPPGGRAAWLPWQPLATVAQHDLSLVKLYQGHTDALAILTWPWDRCLTLALRLVALAPHPDRELLMCGGLLAQHAQAGGERLIVGVTDCEASHAGSPAWSAHRLAAAARALERKQGLARLGLPFAEVCRLGLPDGKLGQHRPALMVMLSALLRSDDVVVSTWRRDGHPLPACGGAA
jgi:hypothetical protein